MFLEREGLQSWLVVYPFSQFHSSHRIKNIRGWKMAINGTDITRSTVTKKHYSSITDSYSYDCSSRAHEHTELNICVQSPENTSGKNVTPTAPSLSPFHQFCMVSCHSASLLSHHSDKIICHLWFWVYMRTFRRIWALWEQQRHSGIKKPQTSITSFATCYHFFWHLFSFPLNCPTTTGILYLHNMKYLTFWLKKFSTFKLKCSSQWLSKHPPHKHTHSSSGWYE